MTTVIETQEYGTLPFQHYFVKYKWKPIVTKLDYAGAKTARLSPEVDHALQKADIIVLCPSNPLLSIAPILVVGNLRQRLENRAIPCIAVSPLISGGKAVKGPADKLMGELGIETPQILALLSYYQGLIDTASDR